MLIKFFVWFLIIFVGSILVGANIVESLIIGLITAIFATWYNNKDFISSQKTSLKSKEDTNKNINNDSKTVDLESLWVEKFGTQSTDVVVKDSIDYFGFVSANKPRKIAFSICGFWLVFGSMLYKSADTSKVWYEIFPDFINSYVVFGYRLGIQVFRESEYHSISISGFLYFVFFPIFIIILIAIAYEWINENK